MIDIGQLLRQTREAKEFSLSEVEAQTRIRQRYLAALESDDWNQLPNPVVARGFLTTYARFLGLDPETLLGQLDKEKPRSSQPVSMPAPAPTSAQPYRPIELRLYEQTSERSGLARWLVRIVALLVVAAAVVYLVVRFALPLLGDARSVAGSLLPATPTLPPAGTPPSTPLIIVGVTDTPTPAPSATPRPLITRAVATATSTPPGRTPTTTAIDKIDLRLEVLQRAWVRLTADGQVLEEVILSPGFIKEYTATNNIQVRTGNAAGLQLTVNGEVQPSLGKTGDIVDAGWALENGVLVVQTPVPDTTTTPSPSPSVTVTSTVTPQP